MRQNLNYNETKQFLFKLDRIKKNMYLGENSSVN